MSLYQLTIPRDNDYEIINQFLQLDCLHYVELNGHVQPHQLLYADILRRAEETSRKLAYMEDVFSEYNVKMEAPQSVEELNQAISQLETNRQLAARNLYPKIELDVNDQEAFIKKQKYLILDAINDYRECIQRICVLEEVTKSLGFSSDEPDAEQAPPTSINAEPMRESLLDREIYVDTNIVYFGGTIEKREEFTLKRLLFRATRGKSIFRTFELKIKEEDTIRGDDYHQSRVGYIVIFEEGEKLRAIIQKVCQSFIGPVFETSYQNVKQQLKDIRHSRSELRAIIVKSKQTLFEYLNQFSPLKGMEQLSLLKVYKQFLIREKTIYQTLNMFKTCNTLLVGLAWVPTKNTQDLFDKKTEMYEQRLNPHVVEREVDQELTRPSHFESNEFTWVFQEIVNTYGIPTYKEANPAVFACVTFPFLFGVMFGDLMHGSILLGFALYLVFATPTSGSIIEAAAPGRYFAVLMGIFAIFCGVCYNDYSSVPVYMFGDSCYVYTEGSDEPVMKDDCVYPVGVDPSWYLTPSELTFMNSMKMKIAVIFGVAQMTLGILLKGTNALYFRSGVDFLFEFVPQLVTLLALFGFMDYLIIDKWLTDFNG